MTEILCIHCGHPDSTHTPEGCTWETDGIVCGCMTYEEPRDLEEGDWREPPGVG